MMDRHDDTVYLVQDMHEDQETAVRSTQPLGQDSTQFVCPVARALSPYIDISLRVSTSSESPLPAPLVLRPPPIVTS